SLPVAVSRSFAPSTPCTTMTGGCFVEDASVVAYRRLRSGRTGAPPHPTSTSNTANSHQRRCVAMYPASMSSAEVPRSPRLSDRFRGFLPVVVDVETGGFNPLTDALLEIAAVIIHMQPDGRLY